MTAELPNFKKFVTEDEIEEARKKRQEEWEKVRQPDQPEEAPEEEYDPRSLFERLEANRIKKQEEYDEAHRLKNMVKGLENDEIEFLEQVSRQREEEEQNKALEEKLLLAEYKSSLVYDRTKESAPPPQAPAKKPPKPATVNTQKQLLSGIVRKKRTSAEDSVPAKTQKLDADVQNDAKSESQPKNSSTPVNSAAATAPVSKLPGIGDYSDSADSDDDS